MQYNSTSMIQLNSFSYDKDSPITLKKEYLKSKNHNHENQIVDFENLKIKNIAILLLSCLNHTNYCEDIFKLNASMFKNYVQATIYKFKESKAEEISKELNQSQEPEYLFNDNELNKEINDSLVIIEGEGQKNIREMYIDSYINKDDNELSKTHLIKELMIKFKKQKISKKGDEKALIIS